MEEPLFYEIPVTGFFSALAELFSEIRYTWGRFVIYLGDYSFSFWDFVIFTLVFYILVMRFFFESDD